MNLEELNEYVNEKLGMEIVHNFNSVSQEVEAWQKAIDDKDMIEDFIEDNKKTIEELKKYMDYYCAYAFDLESLMFGKGFVIADKDFNYIGFVRTI